VRPQSKTALVTGASEGLGFHVARGLAERGYQITLVSRHADKLEGARKRLPGNEHKIVAADLSTKEGVDELSRLLEGNRYGVLVNNAGSSRFGALTTLSPEHIDQMLHLNLAAPVQLSRTFLATAQPGSVLVNVTSIVGTTPMPGNALYSAAKAGMQAMTECLWYEARQKGIRVIDFRPAGLKTNFHAAAGGSSMSGATAASPEAAAKDLVAAIEGRREFVYIHGLPALLLECLRRTLPKRVLILMTGKQSKKVGYL
jgi:short-subunit dehydrogenase